jgi:hypothetical protein
LEKLYPLLPQIRGTLEISPGLFKDLTYIQSLSPIIIPSIIEGIGFP